ncbi:MAG TPA: protein kinase, partial [Ktedonobacteraceae bacterium]
MTNRQGQRLGNYRLIRLLGQGGFAEVYLGEHVFLGTQAAIKVLLVRLTDEEMEGFLKEARTIAGLTHPNILRVLEFGVENNVPFLVLEFAPNGTLRKRVPKGSILPLTVIVPYVSQIASALQYIHTRKLIHRDIKPENLLLGTNYEVLLSDFGLAIGAQSSRSQSMKDVAGTVAYMAPEQVKGRPSPASDQYALGVTVYEWLCGSPPFNGTFTEIVSQHMSVPPPSLRSKIPGISPEIEQVVLKALAKDPQQRFTSVQTFANALEQAVLGQPFVEPIQSIATQDSLPLQKEPAMPPFDTIKGLPLQEQPAQSTVSTTLEHQWSPTAQSIGTWEGGDVLPGPPTVMVASVALSRNELKDFFISYNSTNFAWAAWIAQQLEEAGYSTLFPPWGLRLDSDFDLEMQKAAAKAKRIIAVLSLS